MDEFVDFDPKRAPNFHTEQNLYNEKIEPWRDEPHTLPLQLIKTQSEKFKLKQKKIMKRFASLEIHSKSISVSPKKQRASRQLPKMNIGNIHQTKNPLSRPKSIQTVKRKRKSEITLPAVSVARQLMIERKLYLMKKKADGESPSPKRRCLRDIIEQKAMK